MLTIDRIVFIKAVLFALLHNCLERVGEQSPREVLFLIFTMIKYRWKEKVLAAIC